MKREYISTLFYISAVFNWALAIMFYVFPHLSYKLYVKGALPESYVFLSLFAGLVFIFGLGYFWAARDFERNRSIVKLAVLGKILMFITALVMVLVLKEGKWLLLLTGAGDFVFALLFISALNTQATKLK